MRKLGAVVGVAVLGVALAGWMRPTVPGAQGGGTISGSRRRRQGLSRAGPLC